MLDWLFGKARNATNENDIPRVMIWSGNDPDEWLSYWWESDGWRIPDGIKYAVCDLRDMDDISRYDDFCICRIRGGSDNVAVIHNSGWDVVPSKWSNITFVHDSKNEDSGQTETNVSIHGDDPNGTMARVAQMMAINQTTIHGISYVQGGRMLDVVTESIHGPFAIRVPEGERAYIYDAHLREDGTMTGYVIHVDKDIKIPAEAMEMFKAIGKLNAK